MNRPKIIIQRKKIFEKKYHHRYVVSRYYKVGAIDLNETPLLTEKTIMWLDL